MGDGVLAVYNITAMEDVYFADLRNSDCADLSGFNCVFSFRFLDHGSL